MNAQVVTNPGMNLGISTQSALQPQSGEIIQNTANLPIPLPGAGWTIPPTPPVCEVVAGQPYFWLANTNSLIVTNLYPRPISKSINSANTGPVEALPK